jgi:hypothetical protein
MAAASVASSSAASRSRLLVTPCTPPRDVLVWNRREKSWLRVDLGDELEPTAEWLRDAITRQLGGLGRSTRLFLGHESTQMAASNCKRPIDYFTFGEWLQW